MTNPFDLRGPEFLAVYAALGVAVILLIIWIRRSAEAGEPRPLSDYLEIAFLRGGASEAIRVAIVTLLDRGLLAISGTSGVRTTQPDAARRVTKATERAIVTSAANSATAQELIADPSVAIAATAECEDVLVRRGLLPSAAQKSARLRLWLLAGGALAAVAGIKIAIALARGRTNILFLVIAGLAFLGATFAAAHPRRTSAGNALVKDLKTLFNGLKDRSSSFRPNQGGNDLALLAAVYGIGATLPIYPEAQKLFPRADSSSSSGSSCGSSCGSSSGSSCGSSGGSSCGGGGGGCGGCGS